MVNDNGNGHDPAGAAIEDAFEGVKLKLSDLKRQDGILTRGMSAAQQGVLQRSMTAIDKDLDYRQELKTGFFLTTEEADKVSAAISEAQRYGCSLTPIVDWLVARSAGVNGGRLRAIFETISHTTFTTNYTGAEKNHWWSRNGNSPTKQSPLD